MVYNQINYIFIQTSASLRPLDVYNNLIFTYLPNNFYRIYTSVTHELFPYQHLIIKG